MTMSVDSSKSSYWVVPLQNGNYNLMQDPDDAGEPEKAQVVAQNVDEKKVNDYFVANSVDMRLSAGVLTGGGTTSFDSPYPIITAAGGTSVPAQSVAGLADWMSSSSALSDAALMWMTLSVLSRLASQEIKDARMLREVFKQGKLLAKQNEIRQTEDKIEEEKKNASLQLWTSLGSCAASLVLSTWGAGKSNAAEASASGGTAAVGDARLGAALSSLGTMISQVGPKAADYYAKMYGPQARADQKQLDVMRSQLEAEMLEQASEGAKENYDEAKKVLDDALKLLVSHAEMVSQQIRSIHQA